jgi:D-lactate dehydrogenase (cytochrome)
MNALHTAQTFRRELPPEMIAALKGQFAERFSMANAVRDHHGKDRKPRTPRT